MDCFSYRSLLEIRFRQGQVHRDAGAGVDDVTIFLAHVCFPFCLLRMSLFIVLLPGPLGRLAGFIVTGALVDTKRERYKLVPEWL